jgi:hypothetical protein
LARKKHALTDMIERLKEIISLLEIQNPIMPNINKEDEHS